VGGAGVPGLHAEDDLLRRALLIVVEVSPPVYTTVGSLALFDWPRAGETERPELELIRVTCGQVFGIGQADGLADDLKLGCVAVTCGAGASA
jgi:hypothetical protein